MAMLRLLEVTEEALNQNLVTEDMLRAAGVLPADMPPAQIESYIAASSALVASYTRRVWRWERVKETIHSGWWYTAWGSVNAPRSLALLRYPVTEMTVTVNGELLTDADWLLDARSGLIWRACEGRAVSWAAWNVVLEYGAGYQTEAEIPADVRQACMLQVAHFHNSSGRDPSLRSINIPGVQEETYFGPADGASDTSVSTEVAAMLMSHMDMRG